MTPRISHVVVRVVQSSRYFLFVMNMLAFDPIRAMSLTFEDITAQGSLIPTEAALDHNTRRDAAITGAAHNDLTPSIEATAIDLTVTHCIDHIADHPHTEALQVISPEIAVGHIHDHPTDLQGMNHVDQVHNPAGQEENHIPRRT